MASDLPQQPESKIRWYQGITRYQWLVLVIASAGWVFDIYEGQIFNITRGDMLNEIVDLPEDSEELAAANKKFGDFFLAIFLLGGTVGGLLFGSLADRYGRRSIMIVTILMYSLFSGLTFFASELWHVAMLRFFVAMGVGGEWAVAASLVAENFPTRSRAQAAGIFHASSVLGTWMAALAGLAVGAAWRYAYLFGLIPALLVLWVRSSVKDPEKWTEIAEVDQKKVRRGSFAELLLDRRWNRRALLGMALAAVGLGTFWAVTVAGQDIVRETLLAQAEASGEVITQEFRDQVAARSKFGYGIVQTAGGGLGLLAFGPLCAWIGRRRAFMMIHLMACAIVPVAAFLPSDYTSLLLILPVFGFFTLGMHAGYAIYFPELFPTHLRATGTSFCFNGGRILAVPVLLFSGWLKSQPGMELGNALTMLGGLFLVGFLISCFLPETKNQDLPETHLPGEETRDDKPTASLYQGLDLHTDSSE